MKATHTKRGTQAGPTLDDLMRRAGVTMAQIEANHRVSITTTWRARRGTVPGPLHLEALARAVGESVEVTRAAIERSDTRKAS